MKKIDDDKLLEMSDRGERLEDIAKVFGVSPSACCQRLKKLRTDQRTEAALDALTEKQRNFVLEVASGRTQTEAARAAFDALPDSAKVIGCNLMKQQDIQTAITAVMEAEGLTRSHLVRQLRRHVDGRDPNVSLRATEIGLKLHDAFPVSKRANLNINASADDIVDLSRYT